MFNVFQKKVIANIVQFGQVGSIRFILESDKWTLIFVGILCDRPNISIQHGIGITKRAKVGFDVQVTIVVIGIVLPKGQGWVSM